MDIELVVDEKEIALNEFVKKIFGGMVAGAVMSLRGIKEDWKEIRLEIKK
jgi:hypothetical protein